MKRGEINVIFDEDDEGNVWMKVRSSPAGYEDGTEILKKKDYPLTIEFLIMKAKRIATNEIVAIGEALAKEFQK